MNCFEHNKPAGHPTARPWRTLPRMDDVVAWLLMAVFAAHLAVCVVLGSRRREWYYLALIVTFSLLTGAFALLLFAPGLTIADRPAYVAVRYAAWAAALVSISWTVARLVARRRA